ncbi:hypothetical protein BJ742DRAFT_833467 [Cladochytrium replicatum]|nr:hypothetical protein BJ742DRAFT_833467 [Cladochytrium replicatum]
MMRRTRGRVGAKEKEYQSEVKRSKPNVRASVSQVGLPAPSTVAGPSEAVGTTAAASAVPTINLPQRIPAGPEQPYIPDSLKYARWWNCDPSSPLRAQIVKNAAKQDHIDRVGGDPMDIVSEGQTQRSQETQPLIATWSLSMRSIYTITSSPRISHPHRPSRTTTPVGEKGCTRFEAENLSRVRALAQFQTHFPLFAGVVHV